MPQPSTPRGFASAAPVYLELGWTPIPLPTGKKSPPPPGYTGTDGKTPTAADIDRWLLVRFNSNIGLHMSPTIVGIDVDDYEGKDGSSTLAALEAQNGPLPPTWSSTSRGEGASRIYFYTIPAGVTFPGVLGPGIDVIQHHHRYAVVAPSTHPDSGDRYRWYTQTGETATQPPPTTDLAELPPAWVEGLRTRDTPHAKQAQPLPGVRSAEDSIAERVNHEHDWHDVLAADGWAIVKNSNSETDWVRPGKDGRKGISAVLHEPTGPFNCFTTSVTALQQPWADRNGTCWSYSMFGYLAATRYNGDRSACAREYRSRANQADAWQHTRQTVTTAAHQLDQDGPERPDDDWATISLTEIAGLIRTGEYEPTMPTILDVRDGMPLLYAERINSIFGESGGGKTWLALQALTDVVRNGGRVLFIDYEDNPNGIAERLVLLGLTDEEIALVDYRNPTSGIGYGIQQLKERAIAGEYALIIIDSTGEAMAAGGVDSNSDNEVAQWFALCKQLLRLPGAPAVLVLDHIPKATDAPTAYAIGSQRKRAAVTGAAYRVETIKEPARGKNGLIKLVVTKDRPGNRAKGATAAMAEIRSSVDGSVEIDLHISDAQLAAEAGERFRPTVYMERVSRWIEDNPSTPKRQLILDVQGKRDVIEEALEVLIDEGWINADVGPRGVKTYRIERQYREFEDLHERKMRAQNEPDAHPRTTRAPAAHYAGEVTRAPAHPPRRGCALGAQVHGAENEGQEIQPRTTNPDHYDPDTDEDF